MEPRGEPARLKIRLLGSVEITLDGERLPAFDSLRLQRFLALLALRNDLQHRARLAFELWPDSDEHQARTNLRKLLHDVRRALPDVAEFAEIDQETVRLLPTASAEVDVWRFRDAIAAGDLEHAAKWYTGDLLPACYDDWILDERARLRSEAHGALVLLTEDAAARGDHKATIGQACHLIDLEPTDEVAVRFLMEAHLELGDRSAALRAYHRYAEVLERELGLTPGGELDALYERLRTFPADRRERPAGDQAAVAELPFVGRDAELGRLAQAWDSVQQNGAHLLLVTGEPGIGKSRLAQELVRRVRADGHVVASARAHEAAGRLPWGPVVDLLRSDALRSQVDALDSKWRIELARLLPELSVEGQQDRSARSGDLAQRYRLFDALSRALAAANPRLMIIDDLQWCDAETIEVISFLIRSGQTAPILVVGTVRSEEVPERHPLHALVDTLMRDGAVTTVALDPLDEAATAMLSARFLAGDAPDPEFAARLWAETEGNPLFIIEALRGGMAPNAAQSLLTPTMRAVLGARLGQLPDGPRRLADVAAVIGRPFSVGLVASVTGIEEHELVDDVDELWRRRIIRDHGLTYDFSHDKLRAVALEMVSPARRRQLHRAVAEAIVVERHEDIDAASPLLAAHYDQAGMADEAIEAYQLAGARAVRVSALDEAATMFRRALSLLADVPWSRGRDALELELRIALGSPLVALEGYGAKEAHQLYERALSLCRRLDRPVDPPILRGLGLARLQGCRFDECSDLGGALLRDNRGDPIAMTEGRYLLGVSAFWRGDLAAARGHLRVAIETYDDDRRDEHLGLYAQDPKAVCLVRLALVDLWDGDPGEAAGNAQSALELADKLDHLMTSWYVITYAAILAAEAEDLARLGELLGDADRLGRRLPMRYLMIVGEALRGWLDVVEGSPAGIETIEASVAHSRVEGETLHLSYCLLLLARAHAILGDHDSGRAAAREGLSWTDRTDQRYLEAELWRVDGELAHGSGYIEAAASSLRTAADVARAHGAVWSAMRALQSHASRFPDDSVVFERLGATLATIPSGHNLPPFRAAADLLSPAG
jgi:DNA-binding SARP family transcriptional activator/tetratricopeptide (TPR) repeat protein